MEKHVKMLKKLLARQKQKSKNTVKPSQSKNIKLQMSNKTRYAITILHVYHIYFLILFSFIKVTYVT